MALSEEEQSRLDALERSLLSTGSDDHSHMPEVERVARTDDSDGPEFLAVFVGGRAKSGSDQTAGAHPVGGADGPGSRRPAGAAQRVTPRRIGLTLLLVLLGIGLYAVALWAQQPWVGAGGFVLLLLAVGAWLRPSSGHSRSGAAGSLRGGPAAPGGTGRGRVGSGPMGRRDAPGGGRKAGGRGTTRPGRGGPAASGGSRSSFMERLEGRWEIRRNQRGQ